jgi:uncharacterized Zn finger protein (UPF0148 family)
MGKSEEIIKEDEMWCPECGAPIKKGFFTCSNCKIKVRMTAEINRDEDKNNALVSGGKPENTPSGRNPLNSSGHPRYWRF